MFVVIQLGLSTLLSSSPVFTTSFGGGGGSYKTTAFIHGAFNSELGVDKSEGAGMHSLRRGHVFSPWDGGPDTSTLFLCQRHCSRASPLDVAHVYPWAMEAGAKGQAIVLDPQERRTVADCGHNA